MGSRRLRTPTGSTSVDLPFGTSLCAPLRAGDLAARECQRKPVPAREDLLRPLGLLRLASAIEQHARSHDGAIVEADVLAADNRAPRVDEDGGWRLRFWLDINQGLSAVDVVNERFSTILEKIERIITARRGAPHAESHIHPRTPRVCLSERVDEHLAQLRIRIPGCGARSARAATTFTSPGAGAAT